MEIRTVKNCPHSGCMYFPDCDKNGYRCTQEQIELNPDQTCIICCGPTDTPFSEYCHECGKKIIEEIILSFPRIKDKESTLISFLLGSQN